MRAARPASWRAANRQLRLGSIKSRASSSSRTAAIRHTSLMNSNASVVVSRKAPQSRRTMRSLFAQVSVARQGQSASPLPTPNHSIKRTCLRQAAYLQR